MVSQRKVWNVEKLAEIYFAVKWMQFSFCSDFLVCCCLKFKVIVVLGVLSSLEKKNKGFG